MLVKTMRVPVHSVGYSAHGINQFMDVTLPAAPWDTPEVVKDRPGKMGRLDIPVVPSNRCRMPGCSSRIGRDNKSGVCRRHIHQFACACSACMAKAPS